MPDISFYNRCIEILETAFSRFQTKKEPDIEYDVYRSACVKEFELIMEQSGRLLRKTIEPFLAGGAAANRLTFRSVFRQASQRGLITEEECERWMEYRDNRNSTAHDYGFDLAEQIIKLLPEFIADAKRLGGVFNDDIERETPANTD
ncbi:MAG: nucleotidyltransferase substrate binding protein [Planctomycetaceae bacterium]|nr:nucleotidyltransferase substrate binding protein [Planctomycetaceae bacterium]